MGWERRRLEVAEGEVARLQAVLQGEPLLPARAGARMPGCSDACPVQTAPQPPLASLAKSQPPAGGKPKDLCKWGAELRVVLTLMASARRKQDALASAAGAPPPPFAPADALAGKLSAALGGWRELHEQCTLCVQKLRSASMAAHSRAYAALR